MCIDLTSIGLCLDILGVILLWKFGLPPRVDRTGAQHYIRPKRDEAEIKKGKLFDQISHFAVGIIVLGFILQLISRVASCG